MTRAIRVLHVDDEPDLAEMAATFLEREEARFTVETATSASEGLEQLDAADVDCVVSDYEMPRTNGIEFLEAVRERDPDLPFILYTGKGSEEIASKAISAGVTDYLQKEHGTSQYTVLANRVQNAVETHRAQQELADRQRRLDIFFEESPLGVIEWDEQFNVVRANETATDILGYPADDLVGASWEQIVPESERDDVDGAVSELRENDGGFHSVNENVRNDGERITCEWHNRVVTDENGEVLTIFSKFQDVTDRTARQRELEAQVTAIEAAADGIAILDDDGEYVYMNENHAAIYGFDDPDDLLGKTWRACYNESVVPRFETDIMPELRARGTWQGELTATTAHGRTLDHELTLTEVDDGRIVSVVRDVTDRNARQRELERTKRRYDAIFQDPNILVGALDPDGRVRDINETAMAYVEADLEDVRDDPFWETPWWGDDAALRADVEGWVERAASGEYVEFEADITGPEEDRTVRGVFRPVTTADGDVESIVVSDRDVTERKRHERELERLWDRVEFLLEATDAGIWEWDLATDTFDRHGIHRLFDLPEPDTGVETGTDGAERPSSEDFLDHIHPDDRPRVEASLSRLRSGNGSYRIEYRVLPDGGTATDDAGVRWLEDRAHVRADGENPAEVVGLLSDVTDRKQRERAIQALHATAQDLWTVETPEAVAETIVDAARDILDLPANAAYLYDEEDDSLQPVAATDRASDFIGDFPIFDRGEGLAWEVFETGDAQVHDDVSSQPGRVNQETPVRSEMILPLNEHGVFMVGCPEPGMFDETDVSLMQTLTAHAANALSQIERERRLTALQERVQTLMHTPTKEGTAQAAVEAAHEILGSPSCGVHAVDADGDGLAPVAFVDTIRADFEAPTYDRTDEDDLIGTLVWQAFETKETLVLDDTRERGGLADASPVRSAIIHPLGEYGVFLVTAAQPAAFEGADKTFIEILATSLTTALERVERETNLQERDRDLQRQIERLEGFAGLVSHDLRNPLNIAQGRVEFAQEECDSEHLVTAAHALERCQRLIDDVLTLAREGESVGAVESVHLPQLIEDCWAMVETETATLRIETDQWIEADQSRVQQLFENVIHNAIEHGGEDVTVTVGDVEDGFYVADDGPGIPDDERDDVFDAGYSTSDDGTGFGLNIVREIATAHDWSVHVTRSDAGGARFEFRGIERE